MTPTRPLLLLLALFPALAFAACDRSLQPPPTSGPPQRILFVGNSFLHGHAPPVLHYNAARVTDLNGTHYGGVPGVFKQLADEAGLQVAVGSELMSGQSLRTHLEEKRSVITGQPWDVVVLQDHSLMNPHKPGDAAATVRAVGTLEAAVHEVNPRARVYLLQTWARADQVYQTPGGRWAGRGLEAMQADLRAGYALAAQQAACVAGVLPVGDAALRAVQEGVADRNPYDGIEPGQVNLWGPDSYHFGPWGSYLEALVIFGRLTGRDPTSLGPQSRAGRELGLTPAEVEAAQRVASRELQAVKPAASPAAPSRP